MPVRLVESHVHYLKEDRHAIPGFSYLVFQSFMLCLLVSLSSCALAYNRWPVMKTEDSSAVNLSFSFRTPSFLPLFFVWLVNGWRCYTVVAGEPAVHRALSMIPKVKEIEDWFINDMHERDIQDITDINFSLYYTGDSLRRTACQRSVDEWLILWSRDESTGVTNRSFRHSSYKTKRRMDSRNLKLGKVHIKKRQHTSKVSWVFHVVHCLVGLDYPSFNL